MMMSRIFAVLAALLWAPSALAQADDGSLVFLTQVPSAEDVVVVGLHALPPSWHGQPPDVILIDTPLWSQDPRSLPEEIQDVFTSLEEVDSAIIFVDLVDTAPVDPVELETTLTALEDVLAEAVGRELLVLVE